MYRINIKSTALLFAVLRLVSGQQCPGGIGRDDTNSGSARRDNQFYINRGSPATCNGTITSFSYCYYGPTDTSPSVNEYLVTIAVYRPQGGKEYSAVSPTFVLRKTRAETNGMSENSFTCSALTLDQPVTVQSDDVLGACVVDNLGGSIFRLDIAGRKGSGNPDGDVLRVASGSCSETSVPSNIDFATLSGVTESTRVLFLSAVIETIPATTAPPITTQIMESTTVVTPTEPPNTSELFTTQSMESTTVVTPTEPPNTSELVTTGGSIDVQRTTDDGNGTNASEEFVGGSDEVTTAIVVVIVLIIVVVSVVVLIVTIVLLLRRQKQTKKSYPVIGNSSINNQLYIVAGENAPKFQDGSQLTQSQEHVYEFDAGYSASRSSEYAYAEVGPFNETSHGEVVYESPLDAPAISYAKLLEKNKEEDIYVGENPYEVPATREDDIYTQLKSWGVRQIKPHEFEVVDHLGSGQFGSVEQGVWNRQGAKPVDVALKSLTKTSNEDKVKFLQEAAIMAQFKHPNVIMLHGVVIRGDPMMLVVELAKKGDLRKFLFSIRPDPGELVPSSTPRMLLKFSQQVSLGMQYLSAKGFVHRDLAARNVLVTDNNDCKVADFGMSRDLADENYYVSHGKDKIPVKWTAPEALHYKKYSTASDVWAYGCILYETWSLGHKPFERVSNFEAIMLLDSGKRLSPPPGCPKIIYELMILCWHPESSQRISFRDIVLTLVGSEDMVLNIPEENSSTNPLAGVLGASLEAGENMYSQLQRRYLDFYHGTGVEADGDYFTVN